MFLLRKAFESMIAPAPFCVGLSILGLILLWFTRRQRAGKAAVSLGVLALAFLGNENVTEILLRPLENRYPPATASSGARPGEQRPPLRFVVVLGGSFDVNPRLPVTSQLGEDTLVRLMEGIRLYRELAGAKLIVSGGSWPGERPQAELMAEAAQTLGVRPEDIVLESQSRDTEEEARRIKPVVGSETFVLVTSAPHMVRAMALFKKMGMNPIAAPTEYLVRHGPCCTLDDFLPGWKGLREAERAEHEYLGLAWAKLRFVL